MMNHPYSILVSTITRRGCSNNNNSTVLYTNLRRYYNSATVVTTTTITNMMIQKNNQTSTPARTISTTKHLPRTKYNNNLKSSTNCTTNTNTTRRISSSTGGGGGKGGTTTGSGGDDSASTIGNADVIQGPSLLRTSLSRFYRPQPSLLFLPGLRCLPFWSREHQFDNNTSNNNNNSSNSNSTKIAYQDPEVTTAVQYLESNYQRILEEYNAVSDQYTNDYHPQQQEGSNTNTTAGHSTSLHTGQWDWHSYMLKGVIQNKFVQHYPITSSILNELRSEQILFEKYPFGYCFFSTLYPSSQIQPHTGPMNLRLRIHLPIIVPVDNNKNTNHHHQKDQKEDSVVNDNNSNTNNNSTDNKKHYQYLCGIRVGPIQRPWHAGQALVFDDTYEHEVWNLFPPQEIETTTTNNNNTTIQNDDEMKKTIKDDKNKRVILLVDIWHPDVTFSERQEINQMFQHAQQKGWLSS